MPTRNYQNHRTFCFESSGCSREYNYVALLMSEAYISKLLDIVNWEYLDNILFNLKINSVIYLNWLI